MSSDALKSDGTNPKALPGKESTESMKITTSEELVKADSVKVFVSLTGIFAATMLDRPCSGISKS